MLLPVLNPSDVNFYDNAYDITIGVHCSIHYVVLADSEQEAIDTIIDHYHDKKKDYEGFFLSEEDLQEMKEEEKDQYIYGGNYCEYLSFAYSEMRIKQLDKKPTSYYVSDLGK